MISGYVRRHVHSATFVPMHFVVIAQITDLGISYVNICTPLELRKFIHTGLLRPRHVSLLRPRYVMIYMTTYLRIQLTHVHHSLRVCS